MKNLYIKIFLIIIILIVIFCMPILLKKYRTIKISFLGDSITEFGWRNPNGYVHLVENSLNMSGLKTELIPAGIRGNTTRDMLNRIDRDVLDKKPDVVFFMGGINDIWWNLCTFEEFQQNVKIITEKIKQNGAKPIIISLTLISEDVNAPKNKEIDKFNKYLEEYTKKNKINYIDVNTIFKTELKKYNNPQRVLTTDGVHLNNYGNKILADTIVKEFLKIYRY